MELELYIANPAAGFRHFRNYNNLADTNEENELVTLARLEVERRRGRGEFWRWVVTTLVAVAALGASVVSCIDRHPATPRSSAPPVSR